MSLDIKLIRASFEKAKPIADKVATKFYEILFKDFPEAKPLFEQVIMDKQKNALVNSLVFIVDNLENTEKLQDYLFKMGARHVDYGTLEKHYPLVGKALLKTFAHFFGDEWTDDLEDEWKKAYDVISKLMIEGARSKTPDLDVIRKKAKGICHNLIAKTIEEELEKEITERARIQVRKILMKLLEEESEKLMKKAA